MSNGILLSGFNPLTRTLRASALYSPTADNNTRTFLNILAFGSQPVYASVTLVGGSAVIGVLGVPAAWRNVGGVWTLTATSRTAVVVPRSISSTSTDAVADAQVAVRLQVRQPEDDVFVLLRTTLDGRSGYEVGVFNNAGTPTLRIRRVWEGTVVNDATAGLDPWVYNDANGIPASADVNIDVSVAPWSLALAQSYAIEVRMLSEYIEVRINDEGSASIKHRHLTAYTPAADTATFAPSWASNFPNNLNVGWVSSVNGAVVQSAQVYALSGTRSTRADLVVAVAAGNVYIGPMNDLQQIAAGSMSSAGSVHIREFAGKVYMIGGGRARVLDPITLSVANWTPTLGTLPGQTSSGTTTATVMGTQATRLALAGAAGDEQNIWYSAVGDALNFDTGSDLPGRAFTLSGTRPLKIGQPVVAMQEANNSTLIIGCTASMHMVMGDPALGNIETRVLEENIGISGSLAMTKAQEGIVIAHSPLGLFVVPVGGEAVNLSQSVITEGFNLHSTAGLQPLVCRDPQRFRTHIFLTPDDGTSGQHWIYDERIGNWNRGDGGFRPQQYPAEMQPTCSTILNGRLILGCADGYLREFDDAQATDDGTVINAFATLPLVGQAIEGDTRMSDVRVMLSQGSAPTRVVVYGARTPEEVYRADRRKPLATMIASPWRRERNPVGVRSPSMVVVVGPSANGQPWAIELVTGSNEPTRSRGNPE